MIISLYNNERIYNIVQRERRVHLGLQCLVCFKQGLVELGCINTGRVLSVAAVHV